MTVEPEDLLPGNQVHPHRTEDGQWWFYNKKVYMCVQSDEDTQAYLKKMLGTDYENK